MLYDTLAILVIITLGAIGCIQSLKKKKLLPTSKASPQLNNPAAIAFSQAATNRPISFPNQPDFESSDNLSMTIERVPRQEPTLLIEEDEDSHLLKAAEIVVDKIQLVVDQLAPRAASQEELLSRIKTIVQPYTIFHNTEYVEAINSFIAITIERDCGIELTHADLLRLWN